MGYEYYVDYVDFMEKNKETEEKTFEENIQWIINRINSIDSKIKEIDCKMDKILNLIKSVNNGVWRQYDDDFYRNTSPRDY